MYIACSIFTVINCTLFGQFKRSATSGFHTSPLLHIPKLYAIGHGVWLQLLQELLDSRQVHLVKRALDYEESSTLSDDTCFFPLS